MTFAETVKDVRLKLSYSQRELGEELECSQTLISSFELGIKEPSFKMVRKFSEFCKRKKVKISLL